MCTFVVDNVKMYEPVKVARCNLVDDRFKFERFRLMCVGISQF